MKTAILDFNRTLYDPESKTLVPGVVEMLTVLQSHNIPMHLVSRKGEGRGDVLKKFGIEDFFVSTNFVDEKNAQVLKELIESVGANPQEAYIVGDHLVSDIASGNQCGITTIRAKWGKFGQDEPKSPDEAPAHTITSLGEVPGIVLS